MPTLDPKNSYIIKELNKGARYHGWTGWFDPRLIGDENGRAKILAQLKKHNGIWEVPLTMMERVTKASQAQVKHTWASVTKAFPDFATGMKDYLDNKTIKPDFKKINRLKISPEKKWNMMSGIQKQFILRHNREQFQPFKDTLTLPEMGKLSNFKSIRDVLTPVSDKSYNYKNGVVVLDTKFHVYNRGKLFQDYLTQQGIEKVEIPSTGTKGSAGLKGRWKLTDNAIKEGKTFASILAAYPNLKSNPTQSYSEILSTVTKKHPIYRDTQKGLRSLFNFVQDSINGELDALKPKALKTLVENNPALLKQVTGYVDPISKTIKYQGLDGLKNLSETQILDRVRLVTEHNRPLRDYAAKYMDPARLKVLQKNLLSIDADMSHNISLASQWYNNSLKERATNLAEANKNNPKVLEHLSGEFKKMNQRFYANNKFYGTEVATSPSYRTSIVGAWRNNLKGIGLEKMWDKYAGQFNRRGLGTIDDILGQTLKDPNAVKQLGAFFGCSGTFKTFDEGGRVRLQAGGQGLVQCVETNLKKPGGMEKLTVLEDTSPALTKLKTAATGFLNIARKGGKYGAIAAAGAVSAALVKQFMSDDPTTYLSDENQQKNMLIDMMTSPIDETPQERPDILDWQLPVLGAETVAGTAVVAPSTIKASRSGALGATKRGWTKTGLRTLGKGLMATGTPLGLAALEPLHIAGQIQEGDSPTDIATNPWNYLGPTFASSMTRAATKGLGENIGKIMRLGISPTALRGLSRMGGYGFAASLGITGLQKFGDWRNKRGWFSEE